MSSTPAVLDQLLPHLRDEPTLARGELIFCSFCHAAITSRQQQLIMDGQHRHRFTNPRGLHFLIGCFRLAPGCDIAGLPTVEHCWFEGYLWQLAKCSDCGEHLGWFYQDGEADQFFGLIVDKLAEHSA